jgi:hypothetical protein
MVSLVVAIGLFAADSIPNEIVVERGHLRRFIQLQPRFRTTRVENVKTGAVLRFAAETPEFVVETTDGERLTTDDFAVESFAPTRLVLRHVRDRRTIAVSTPSSDRPWLERRLTLEGFGVVRRLVVEAMKVAGRVELGGLGQPLYLDAAWFAGLEHPAGINTFDATASTVHLQQHPSKPESMVAVLGGVATPDDRVEDAFERYIDSIRRRPPTPTLQYNTWYDLRGDELTPKKAEAAADELHRKLLAPHGLSLQAFTIDDGWQAPRSLWDARPEWDPGLGDLASFLQSHRAGLGLWLPLNGASLDVGYGKSKGFPQTNFRKDCYCLHSAAYRDAMKDVLRKHRSTGVAFFKHDFNYLTCSLDGHGHLPTTEHGREANVEGQLELLAATDAVSAVTSNAWPSPYWLKHADYLWIGSYDYAEDWNVPCWSKRQAEITFRDAQIHRLLRIDRTPVPMNALMTHGLIRGRHEGATADRDLDDWADAVMMFVGRGAMLQELYITPNLLSDDEWTILGNALTWARERAEPLKYTRMIGGRPDAGEPYGYVHWAPDMGVLCLRNPSPRPTDFEVSTAERPSGYPGHPVWNARRIYPDRRRLADLAEGSRWSIRLSGHEVAIVELHPAGESSAAPPPAARTSLFVSKNEPDRLDWRVDVEGSGLESKEAIWWTYPDCGVSASVPTQETIASPPNVSAKRWSLHRSTFHRVEPQAQLSMRLPWSPFWPQEANASAVIRTRRPRPAASPEPTPARLELRPDVRPSHRDWIVEETLVLDGWRFRRSRSIPEKVGWLLALGAAPIAVFTTAGRRLGIKTARPKLSRLLAGAGLIALYTLTPLGAALGRIFAEF